jgi:competence protein ComEA
MIKRFQSYFSFTKKELNGLLVLCILIILILVLPYALKRFKKPEVYRFDDFDREMKQFLATAKRKGQGYEKVREEIEDAEFKRSYFKFDPNGLSETSWKKLGLSPGQIRVIKNYEAKGGRFYQNDDLKKIYSISGAQFKSLEPFIEIADKNKPAYKRAKPVFENKSHQSYAAKRYPQVIVDLNAADSAELETIRGIGPAFASRIVKFRNRLGGFYKKEQLLDVYGLDSAKYETLKDQIKVNFGDIQKMNINQVTFDEMKKHPYLTYKQMNAILQYRLQHGDYHSLEDLKKIAIINEEILRKIEPYLLY